MPLADVASADTARGTFTHVYINLNGSPSTVMANEWTRFIGSLRQAAGHATPFGLLQTQGDGGTYDEGGGLIWATIRYEDVQLSLWFTPSDLYLRGITTHDNQTFEFNDGDYNLEQAIRLNHAEGTGGLDHPVMSLGMGSNYNSMSSANSAVEGGQRISRGRERLTMSYSTLTDAFFNLAYLDHTPNGDERAHVARSLMLMIQMTSEAARFNDVMGTTRAIMTGTTVQGLPIWQQRLENNWNDISDFTYQVAYDGRPREFQGISPSAGNTPYGIGNPQTLRSVSDVARIIAILLNDGPANDPTRGGLAGDWKYDEL